MIKSFIISACFGIFFFWMSVLVDAYQTVATAQPDPVSTPVALLVLGFSLCALSFWGKRPKSEE